MIRLAVLLRLSGPKRVGVWVLQFNLLPGVVLPVRVHFRQPLPVVLRKTPKGPTGFGLRVSGFRTHRCLKAPDGLYLDATALKQSLYRIS